MWYGTWKVALPLMQLLGLDTPAKALSSTDLPDTTQITHKEEAQ